MKLWAIIPELILAGLCLGLVPMAGWVRGRWRMAPAIVALTGLAACLFFTGRMLLWAPVPAFEGAYAVDGLANVFKLLIELGAFITIVLIGSYFRGHSQVVQAPVAVLFATLGAVGLASSMDLGLIVLFLQMTSLASYVLVVLARGDPRALEASLKYFIFGAVALAVMAYGLTFLYGLTGSLDLRVIGEALRGGDQLWIALAFSLVVIGYGFEIAMVPFHFWAPDAFTGATAPVSGFLSVVPKTGAVAGLLRLLLYAFPDEAAGWPALIAVLAAITMTFGNLVALRQTELKRLLAYSSIAQAGYILVAVAVASRVNSAPPAAAYYLAAYLFMNLGAFAVAGQLERTLGSDRIAALRGLGKRSPGPAAVLALSLLSLAGIPPLAGFAGKVFLLEAGIAGGMTWLAVVAAANMVLALFYYVSVIAEMYLRPPEYAHRLTGGRGYTLGYIAALAGTLLLGIWPGPNLEIAELAVSLFR
jgi:NADH-quinone oxidoreductase subunit N